MFEVEKLRMHIKKLLLSWFGCGYARHAPGTVGSLAALPIAWVIHQIAGPLGLLVCALFLFLLGWWLIELQPETESSGDPQWIVIDEVTGQWICLAAAPIDVLWYALAFLFFRLLDITKPWIIGKLDRSLTGGLGIMLDDVAAGIAAALAIIVCRLAAGV